MTGGGSRRRLGGDLITTKAIHAKETTTMSVLMTIKWPATMRVVGNEVPVDSRTWRFLAVMRVVMDRAYLSDGAYRDIEFQVGKLGLRNRTRWGYRIPGEAKNKIVLHTTDVEFYKN